MMTMDIVTMMTVTTTVLIMCEFANRVESTLYPCNVFILPILKSQ